MTFANSTYGWITAHCTDDNKDTSKPSFYHPHHMWLAGTLYASFGYHTGPPIYRQKHQLVPIRPTHLTFIPSPYSHTTPRHTQSTHLNFLKVISGKLVKKTMAESINFRGVTENISFSTGRAGSKVRRLHPIPSPFSSTFSSALSEPHLGLI